MEATLEPGSTVHEVARMELESRTRNENLRQLARFTRNPQARFRPYYQF